MRCTKISLDYFNLRVKVTHSLLGGNWAAYGVNVQKWHLVTTYKLFINVDYCLHPNVYLDSINLTEYVFICKDWVNNHIVIERTLNEKEKRNPKYQNCQTTIVLTLPTATYTGIYIYLYIERQTDREKETEKDRFSKAKKFCTFKT